ncbi:MAG: plastocyanin/azurin family copper-binding protein [Fuerstiella sp.]|nr:plastocyanin/azurin family copper-binding protein [Fuerstiella sp.]
MPVMIQYALLIVSVQIVAAQNHHHDHDDAVVVKRPKIFLDKSPRIINYQLKRLDNSRLLLVETAADDPMYAPVFRAILVRAGMTRRNRDDAVKALAAVNRTDIVTELISALGSLNIHDRNQRQVGRQISAMLLGQPEELLAGHIEDFKTAGFSDSSILGATAQAGLIVTGHANEAWNQAQRDEQSRLTWLAAVSLVPDGGIRHSLRDGVVSLLDSSWSQAVRTHAVQALGTIEVQAADSFHRLASFVHTEEFRTAAVRSLLRIPAEVRDAVTSKQILNELVDHAERTPAAQRTTDEFLDAMQLADELLSRVSVTESEHYHRRLREVSVRVVRLRTVEEEMRYDRSYFAVEAGRPVQVVLENDDLMPHNLVITAPGQLRAVALAGAALGTTPGPGGRLYVPDSSDVLFASGMVNAGGREILTFRAPSEPGEYPYVCTFPRHWTRMYGVMLVVPDLNEWQRNPVLPKDPLGNNRSFVRTWKMTDFPGDGLPSSLRGRTPDIGARLFREATCLGCHKMNGEGGTVGPELTDVFKRHHGDYHVILREILEPGYRIDPKYAIKVVVEVDGKTTSGIVTAEDESSISILVNPESPNPSVIRRDNIDEIITSANSMMPKALLDRFTHDEIMEILSYITGGRRIAR